MLPYICLRIVEGLLISVLLASLNHYSFIIAVNLLTRQVISGFVLLSGFNSLYAGRVEFQCSSSSVG